MGVSSQLMNLVYCNPMERQDFSPFDEVKERRSVVGLNRGESVYRVLLSKTLITTKRLSLTKTRLVDDKERWVPRVAILTDFVSRLTGFT